MFEMIINDPIYGKHEFKQPVLVELINTSVVQRLKRISQFGVPEKYYHKKSFSRFDHDVGVAILLNKSGASLEEVIAGMLHDISHTAFSHVIDMAMGTQNDENFQDSILGEFVLSSEIKTTLAKHGFEPEQFLDLEKFPLLERKLPELCADRIDYCLRELGIEDNKKAKALFEGLTVLENTFCFKTKEFALEFRSEFNKLNDEHWTGRNAVGSYWLLAGAVEVALKTGEITRSDLFTDDEQLMKKLEESNNAEVKNFIRRLSDKDYPDVSKILKKKRHVDPSFVLEGKRIKLSKS